MHIILGVLGALGAIAFFLYRVNLGIGAAREIGSEGRGLYRRYKWSKKNKNRPLDTITDPQHAVAVILVMVARERGALTDRGEKAIEAEIKRVFELTDDAASDMLAQAKWAAGDAGEIDSVIHRLKHRIDDQLSEQHRRDILQMMTNVAAAEGEPDQMQTRSIELLKSNWGF